MQVMQIKDKELKIKEFNGKRVVTLRDIDEVHQRPYGTSRKGFNRNKKRFTQGEDYFVLKTDEAKTEFDITAPSGLTLVTESGYLMVTKVFDDDLAWEVQRMLVNNYFRKPEKKEVSLAVPEFFGNISKEDIQKVAAKMSLEAELTRLKSLHYDFSKYAERAEAEKRRYRKFYDEYRIIEEKYRRNLEDIKRKIEKLSEKMEAIQ